MKHLSPNRNKQIPNQRQDTQPTGVTLSQMVEPLWSWPVAQKGTDLIRSVQDKFHKKYTAFSSK